MNEHNWTKYILNEIIPYIYSEKTGQSVIINTHIAN